MEFAVTVVGTADPMVGHVLGDRYEVLSRIARGGMATVYRAQDHRLGRIVAIKIMHEGLGDDADFSRKFDREARSAAKLVHPNIVAVFDQGDDAGRPYMVMELAEGTTLRHLIAREAPIQPLRALELMEPVVAALAYAHEAGLVHRDVKPENVLITDRGQVKVADFGLSRAITGQSASATQGLLIGTVSYLPPEMVTNGRASFRSDVYSAGVVLFELLTGEKPYTGETPIQVAYAHVHNDIPRPSARLAEMRPDIQDSRWIIPPYLDALVQAATRRKPSERPRDARELLDRLRIAKKALSQGILDDPALTERMMPGLVERTDRAVISLPEQEETTGVIVPNGSSTLEPSTPSSSTPQPPARQSRAVYRRRRRLVGLIAALVAIAIALGAWWQTTGSYVAVPPLAGLTRDAAIENAQANRLLMRTSEAYSETIPAGSVISTDPVADERVKRNTEVMAIVSKGPERYPVPTLAGLTLDDAKQTLTDAHLAAGKISQEFSESVAKGIIVRAGIEPGTQAKPATPVDLTVSAGRRPIPVPALVGRTFADAKAQLEASGLAVKTAEQHSDRVAKGTVISHNPPDGTVYRGDPITLVVSKGPVMVTVPTITVGTPEAKAVAAIKNAGLTPKVMYGSPDWLRAGIFSVAEPGAGTQLPKGSTVTIYVV